MDNQLPNIDSGLVRPLNIVAFPLFKGLGYSMEYDKDLSIPLFGPDKRGWWSDNLQNRDDSLVAGQQFSNDVSVGKASLSDQVGWVPYEQLTHASHTPQNALKNLYVCEFNRLRIRTDPTNPQATYPPNVLLNNIVPIDPTLNKTDPRLYEYSCDLSKGMYSPNNISKFNNLLQTETPRDWLYFAANLRGGARETINILYTLAPISGVPYIGFAKVQDGGRFVYWNPANGPNSFLVVDDQVNVVTAKRNELSISQEVLPVTAQPTFDGRVLQLIRVWDPLQYHMEWDMPIHINHYGFGDATVSVYVGGFKGTGCLLSPGDITYARVDFYNNAGFDWEMLESGITRVKAEVKPISANDLDSGSFHQIYIPQQYNFMTVEPPPDLMQYLNITPCDEVVDTPPTFFDFEYMNVLTIRDGWKGSYYYKIQVSPSLPKSFCGRMYELRMHFHEEHFKSLPGMNDPTDAGYHDYHLKIPPLMIGFPYASSPKTSLSGKVFHTYSRASNLSVSHKIAPTLVPVGARLVTPMDVLRLRSLVAEQEGLWSNIDSFWANLTRAVPYTATDLWSYSLITFNLSESYPLFPKPINDTSLGPDEAEVYILLSTHAPELPYGFSTVSTGVRLDFQDFAAKSKASVISRTYTVEARGAFIGLVYSVKKVGASLLPLVDQTLRTDEKGILRVIISATNVGSDIAYHVSFSLYVAPDVRVLTERIEVPYTLKEANNTFEEAGNNITVLMLSTDTRLAPGDTLGFRIYLQYPSYNSTLEAALSGNVSGTLSGRRRRRRLLSSPTSVLRTFVTGAQCSIDLTPGAGERPVTQTIRTPLSMTASYPDAPGLPPLPFASMNFDCSNTSCQMSLSTNLNDTTKYRYVWSRRYSVFSPFDWETIAVTNSSSHNDLLPSLDDIYLLLNVTPPTEDAGGQTRARRLLGNNIPATPATVSVEYSAAVASIGSVSNTNASRDSMTVATETSASTFSYTVLLVLPSTASNTPSPTTTPSASNTASATMNPTELQMPTASQTPSTQPTPTTIPPPLVPDIASSSINSSLMGLIAIPVVAVIGSILAVWVWQRRRRAYMTEGAERWEPVYPAGVVWDRIYPPKGETQRYFSAPDPTAAVGEQEGDRPPKKRQSSLLRFKLSFKGKADAPLPLPESASLLARSSSFKTDHGTFASSPRTAGPEPPSPLSSDHDRDSTEIEEVGLNNTRKTPPLWKGLNNGQSSKRFLPGAVYNTSLAHAMSIGPDVLGSKTLTTEEKIAAGRTVQHNVVQEIAQRIGELRALCEIPYKQPDCVKQVWEAVFALIGGPRSLSTAATWMVIASYCDDGRLLDMLDEFDAASESECANSTKFETSARILVGISQTDVEEASQAVTLLLQWLRLVMEIRKLGLELTQHHHSRQQDLLP
mmetsp:Transcript_7748/g.12391  ORF Transcript_7748/g.12391 Transcript_7748/m.12391 type:complete len:1393 (-) Transcript_7748:698-4876(-)